MESWREIKKNSITASYPSGLGNGPSRRNVLKNKSQGVLVRVTSGRDRTSTVSRSKYSLNELPVERIETN
jgi:hypothetical protein